MYGSTPTIWITRTNAPLYIDTFLNNVVNWALLPLKKLRCGLGHIPFVVLRDFGLGTVRAWYRSYFFPVFNPL